MPLRKSGRIGEEQLHNRQQRIHLGCNSSTMPGFSCGTDVNTAIFTTIITSHPSILQNVPRVGLIPNPVSCSQAVTLSQESSRSHHPQIPPLQHHFPSAPGRREQCQNRASCGCEQGKGSRSLSQNPHLLWHTRGRGCHSRQCCGFCWALQHSSLTPSPSTATQAVNGIRALQSPHSL